MFNLIPMPYRILGACALLVAACGYSYYLGFSGEHSRLVALLGRYAQAAVDQAAQAKQKDIDHEQQTQIIAGAYGADLSRLNATLKRLRANPTGSRTMPENADSPKSVNAPSGQLSRTCTDTIYDRAMIDAQTVNYWHEWAMRMQLPVE